MYPSLMWRAPSGTIVLLGLLYSVEMSTASVKTASLSGFIIAPKGLVWRVLVIDESRKNKDDADAVVE
jgi:hypothetical protein